jgi:hypothetical protein
MADDEQTREQPADTAADDSAAGDDDAAADDAAAGDTAADAPAESDGEPEAIEDDEREPEGEQPDAHADTDTPYITLGPCHYNQDETSSLVAKKPDETGWIPICTDHRQKAEEEGYEVGEPVDPEEHVGDNEPDDDGADDGSADSAGENTAGDDSADDDTAGDDSAGDDSADDHTAGDAPDESGEESGADR